MPQRREAGPAAPAATDPASPAGAGSLRNSRNDRDDRDGAGGAIASGAAPRPPRRGGAALAVALRAAGAALAIGLALLPIWRQRSLAERQELRIAWLQRAGVLVPHELEHETDPGAVDLRAARAALAAEMEPARRSDLSRAEEESQRMAAADRLAETARIAGDVLAERPAAANAAMVMGAATFLSWSFAHDTRLFTQAPSWERPLETAIALAPGRDEAARLLATAYLELWPQLSARKRERERRLLATVFADPDAFASLIGPWLAAAPSREVAFAVIPPSPEAWEKLQQVYAQHFDWVGFCAARERWDLALRATLAGRLAAAQEMSDSGVAREMLLQVAVQARPGRTYLDLLTRALESCPPGSVDRRTGEKLTRHLLWSLERCRLDRCPLSQRATRRLAGFCRDLDPRIDAMASLVTGDLPWAEKLERNYATAFTDSWAPYWLLKAKQLLADRRPQAEVSEALAAIPRSWISRPSYWQVRAAAAQAAADPAAEAAAAGELARLAARDWPPAAWDLHDGVARLELLAAAEAPGIELAIDQAPPRGGAAEVRLDESILGTFPVTAGGSLSLPAAVAPGLHLLEVDSVGGGALIPGAVRLAPPAASGSDAGGAAGSDAGAARGAALGGPAVRGEPR